MRTRILIDHDLNEQDIEAMLFWKQVYDTEVQRVVAVLAYWVQHVRS